jgi:hypothetical protein
MWMISMGFVSMFIAAWARNAGQRAQSSPKRINLTGVGHLGHCRRSRIAKPHEANGAPAHERAAVVPGGNLGHIRAGQSHYQEASRKERELLLPHALTHAP